MRFTYQRWDGCTERGEAYVTIYRTAWAGLLGWIVPAPGNIRAIAPLRFKLSGRPVLSAGLNVETAGSEPKTAGNLTLGVSRNRVCDFLADPDGRSFSRFYEKHKCDTEIQTEWSPRSEQVLTGAFCWFFIGTPAGRIRYGEKNGSF